MSEAASPAIGAAELRRLQHFAADEYLPRAGGGPFGRGVIRRQPEDFRVIEHTGVEPSGSGEHLYVRIRKIGQNTRWVAKRLAEFLDVPYRAVSFAGMKDRHADTEQWLSVHLPGHSMPDFSQCDIDGTRVLETVWHDRKLRPGQLSYNRFAITVRDCEIDDLAALQARLNSIASGVPNYFGEQRFGRAGGNLTLARDHDELRSLNRERRNFALSALRGALFNGWLAERVATGNWNGLQADEAGLSDRPRGAAEDDQSIFVPARQPAGLLWGKGVRAARSVIQQQEQDFVAGFGGVTELLECAGSKAGQRVLVAQVAQFSCQLHDDRATIEFVLGPGCFATAVLRELFAIRAADTIQS